MSLIGLGFVEQAAKRYAFLVTGEKQGFLVVHLCQDCDETMPAMGGWGDANLLVPVRGVIRHLA